ncbi:SGNH/GDSL hydrolase family protein [Puniceicoccus vermicola]|uniref:SGNH hydrolase-type esterase domain-containing protein n=1 Tax=Puniceicoccus vermicola TaxID=388746 RepID=A0A7X1AX09_9BACT|nr:SGNH/GDSL hydrolase family protein [Puniceicoccus vermicola]MBC2601568.1 hypothetical protein [Puniceicoccus vermicola]
MKLPSAAQTHNIAEFIEHPESGLSAISRIPQSVREHLNDNARQRALYSTGCEIRFRLQSPSAKIHIRTCEIGAAHHGPGLGQILFGDFSQTYFYVGKEPTVVEINAPDYEHLSKACNQSSLFDPRLLRVLLPTHTAICEVSVEGEIAPPEAGDIPSRRILNYGSSITHGSGALTSRECWAGCCAHNLGFDLINLGFGGGCHCEPEMTEYLCQRNDFDCAIIETGINMLGLEASLVNERIENLIRRLSSTHSEVPIFCLGVFPCDEDIGKDWNGRAEEIRQFVQKLVATIDSPNLHFIDGKQAVRHSLGMTVDLTHPSPAGMIEIGTYVARQIRKTLGWDDSAPQG